MSKLVAGTLVSLLYPDKNGILVTRKGRFEKTNDKSIVLFVGNGQYETFFEDKISNLQIVSTIYVVSREYYEIQADLDNCFLVITDNDNGMTKEFSVSGEVYASWHRFDKRLQTLSSIILASCLKNDEARLSRSKKLFNITLKKQKQIEKILRTR